MHRRFVGGFQIDLLYSFGDVTHDTAEKGSDHDVDEDGSREAVEGADRNVNEGAYKGADRNVNEGAYKGADRNVKEVVSTELLTVVALIDKIDVFGRRPSLARPVLQVGPPQTCTAFNFCCLGLGFFSQEPFHQCSSTQSPQATTNPRGCLPNPKTLKP
jgi:hypothetical protein